MSDNLVTSIARACPLRRLDVSYCYALSDAGVAAVAQHAPSLAALAVNDVPKLTDAALDALLLLRPHIEVGYATL